MLDAKLHGLGQILAVYLLSNKMPWDFTSGHRQTIRSALA
jgi:hypothetical protein